MVLISKKNSEPSRFIWIRKSRFPDLRIRFSGYSDLDQSVGLQKNFYFDSELLIKSTQAILLVSVKQPRSQNTAAMRYGLSYALTRLNYEFAKEKSRMVAFKPKVLNVMVMQT